MGYIHSVAIEGTNYKIEPTLFTATTNNTTSAALTASLSGFELVTGVCISLLMSVDSGAAATLSINNGTAVPIYYNGNTLPSGLLKQGFIYSLVYDGTNWQIIGDLTDNDLQNALNNVVLPHKLTFGAGGAYVYDGSADVTVPVYTGGII